MSIASAAFPVKARVLGSPERIWLAILCGVSALAAVAIDAISELARRREPPEPQRESELMKHA